MNEYIFECFCDSNERSIQLPTLTMICPYAFDYITKYMMEKLAEPCAIFFSNVFNNETPHIHLKHCDYTFTQLALKETVKQMYAEGNRPLCIDKKISKYGSKTSLDYKDKLSGFFVKDIALFEKVLRGRLLSRELNMDLHLTDNEIDPPCLKITVEGFKDLKEMQNILEKELKFIKNIAKHNKFEWTVVTSFQSTHMDNAFLMFPEIYTVYTKDVCEIMKKLQDSYQDSIFDVHIALDSSSVIYVDLITKKKCDIDSYKEMHSRIMNNDKNLSDRFNDPELKYKPGSKKPVSIYASIDNAFLLRMDTFLVDSKLLNSIMIEIEKEMKKLGLSMEPIYFLKFGVICKIDNCNLSTFEKAEEVIHSMIPPNDEENSVTQKKKIYTELTIYPTYVSFFDLTFPDFRPEKCSIKVPCKYNVDEENALIAFIHNEFPTSEIMGKNKDKMFSGMSGNYTFAVVNREFSLNIAIKSGYGIPIQSLKESFERHMENYTVLYNVKNSIIQNCSKIKYDFTEDYMAGEKVINGSVVMRDDEYHVFADFRTSDHIKAYIREACDSIRRTTGKEVFLHEVPLFIIEQINESSVIKTETIDIYVDGENKNDCTI